MPVAIHKDPIYPKHYRFFCSCVQSYIKNPPTPTDCRGMGIRFQVSGPSGSVYCRRCNSLWIVEQNAKGFSVSPGLLWNDPVPMGAEIEEPPIEETTLE